jgi:hypothetical protein
MHHMARVSISDVVRKLQPFAHGIPAYPDMRERAAFLVTKAIHPTLLAAEPSFVNFGALALHSPIHVYENSAGATRLVHSTDLHTLPGEPPRLLRTAWIVESRRPDKEPLFGKTFSLAGYPMPNGIFLIGLYYPDAVAVSRWTPQWEETELEAGVQRDFSPHIDDVEAHYEWTREAARFALVFSLLLDADRTPLRLRDQSPRRRSGGVKRSVGEFAWTICRVGLAQTAAELSPSIDAPDAMARRLSDDLKPEVVPVAGHIKRQAYGPGLTKRKWIYVNSYEARRWVSPRPDVKSSAQQAIR